MSANRDPKTEGNRNEQFFFWNLKFVEVNEFFSFFLETLGTFDNMSTNNDRKTEGNIDETYF